VIHNLRRVLIVADRAWPKLLTKIHVTPLLDLLPALESIVNSIGSSLALEAEKNKPECLKSNTGWVSRNALYSALRVLPPNGSVYADECCLLLAHIFLAHLAVLRMPCGQKMPGGLIKGDTSLIAYEAYGASEPWPALTISPRHAGLALRGLCSGEEWARALIKAFPLNQSPKRFARTQTLAMDPSLMSYGKKDRWLEDRVDYICNFIRQAYALKPRHRGHGSRKSEEGNVDSGDIASVKSEVRSPVNGVDQPPEAPPVMIAPIPLKAPDQSGRDRLHSGKQSLPIHKTGIVEDCDRFDECPDEDDEWDEEWEGEQDDDGENEGAPDEGHRRRSPGRKGVSTASRRNQAIRASKMFPFGNDRIAPCELVPLEVNARKRLDAIFAELANCRSLMPKEKDAQLSINVERKLLEEADVIAFALVMLWTGSGIERTKSLRVSDSTDFSESVELAILMSSTDEGKDTIIRVHSPFPPYQTGPQAPIEFDRARTQFVLLRDPAGLGPILQKLADFQQIARSKNSGSGAAAQETPERGSYEIFRKPCGYYRVRIEQMLSRWDKTGRLTLTRIEATLFGSVMSWTGKDIIAATMITGTYKTQARVPMYYACRRMDVLQAIYAGTVTYLRFQINQEAQVANALPSQTIPQLTSTLAYGRPASPPSRYDPSPSGTLYVGIRHCPTDSDLHNAVLRLIDQLGRHWDLTRQDHWTRYTDLFTFYTIWYFGFDTGVRPIVCPYLRISEISPLNQTAVLHDKADEKARLVWIVDGLHSQMRFYQQYLQGTRLRYRNDYPCWFLGADGTPLVVQPSTVEPILQEFLPGFASNVHRRWMLNALVDSGCPAECVRAWSGHATAGNEFWGASATASYRQIGSVLVQHLVPILDFLGFIPIPGAAL